MSQTCVSLLDSLKQPNPDGLASPFTAECLDQEKHIEDTNYLILHIFALFGNTIVRILNYLDLQNKQRREQRFFCQWVTLWTTLLLTLTLSSSRNCDFSSPFHFMKSDGSLQTDGHRWSRMVTDGHGWSGHVKQ